MTKTICDICGEKMPTTKSINNIEDLNFCMSSHGKIWDICNDCRISLAKWMIARKKKGDDNDDSTES